MIAERSPCSSGREGENRCDTFQSILFLQIKSALRRSYVAKARTPEVSLRSTRRGGKEASTPTDSSLEEGKHPTQLGFALFYSLFGGTTWNVGSYLPPGMGPIPPALEAGGLNHSAPREVPAGFTLPCGEGEILKFR